MPTPLDEAISSVLLRRFYQTTASLPTAVESKITTTFSDDVKGFTGRWAGSTKISDVIHL